VRLPAASTEPAACGRRRVLVPALIALALLAASCSERQSSDAPAPEGPTEPTTIPDAAKEAILEALLTDAVAEAGSPGGLAAVWGPGGFEFVHAAGLARVDTGEPMQPEMQFRIGSITAAFTCTVLLQLVDEGQLALDQPVSDFIDFVPNGDATLGELCRHTSGIPDFVTSPEFVDQLSADPTRIWSPGEVFALAFTQSPSFPPGTGWQFSATNLWLVGEIIQQVTGRPIDTVIAERVLDPLELSSTAYPAVDEVDLPDPSPDGFWAPDPAAPARDITELGPSWAGPAGALVSDLFDLRAFARGLGTGELVSEAVHERQLESLPVQPDGPVWLGYGLGVVTVGPLVGHHGEIPGFLTAVLHDPETSTTIVVMLNNSTGGAEIALGLAASMAAVAVPDRVPFTSEQATVAFGGVSLAGS
jgi:D-alanyl-D-alanine carboxypeptidase